MEQSNINRRSFLGTMRAAATGLALAHPRHGADPGREYGVASV